MFVGASTLYSENCRSPALDGLSLGFHLWEPRVLVSCSVACVMMDSRGTSLTVVFIPTVTGKKGNLCPLCFSFRTVFFIYHTKHFILRLLQCK